jgi:hypothetical protein
MAYLENIPQPSDQIASSQPEILGNFQYIQSTMQVDHAWDGSGISPSIDGTHQTLSMPNQAVDITSLGATGCALIGYALAGNLYTWNGAKNPVSGVSYFNAAQALTTTASLIITVPSACIGIIMFVLTASGTIQYFPFLSAGGQVYLPSNPISPPPGTVLVTLTTPLPSLNINAKLSASTAPQNAIVKSIYWPI